MIKDLEKMLLQAESEKKAVLIPLNKRISTLKSAINSLKQFKEAGEELNRKTLMPFAELPKEK